MLLAPFSSDTQRSARGNWCVLCLVIPLSRRFMQIQVHTFHFLFHTNVSLLYTNRSYCRYCFPSCFFPFNTSPRRKIPPFARRSLILPMTPLDSTVWTSHNLVNWWPLRFLPWVYYHTHCWDGHSLYLHNTCSDTCKYAQLTGSHCSCERCHISILGDVPIYIPIVNMPECQAPLTLDNIMCHHVC